MSRFQDQDLTSNECAQYASSVIGEKQVPICLQDVSIYRVSHRLSFQYLLSAARQTEPQPKLYWEEKKQVDIGALSTSGTPKHEAVVCSTSSTQQSTATMGTLDIWLI